MGSVESVTLNIKKCILSIGWGVRIYNGRVDIAIQRAEMEYIERLAEEFIDLDQSTSFQDAQRIVKKHTAMLDSLKRIMKKDNIRCVKVRRGRLVKRLKFTIRQLNRVDTNSIPEEIRQKYMMQSDVWWKQVDILDMSEDIEAVQEEDLGSLESL